MSKNREQANIKALELATKHFFAGKESVVTNKQPKIICFFGQPGVGKSSSVKPKVIEELEPSSLIDLEVDELKSFAPILADEVGKITQTNAAKYAPISQWFSGLADRAIKNNNHLCISRQRLLLTPHKTMALIRKAKKAGFNSEFCFTAAHPLKSISGMAKRYEMSLEKAIKKSIIC